MNEQVIIVFGTDGEIIGVVRPMDALNVQFTLNEIIAQDADITAEVHNVLSFLHYSDAQEG